MEFAGKRILMLLENEPYKEDIRVKREARALLTDGHDVSVICPRKKGDNWFEIVDDGIRLYQYPPVAGGKGFISYMWEYGYALVMMFLFSLFVWLRTGFDIIHAHDAHAHSLAVMSAAVWRNNTPIVLSRRVTFGIRDNAFSRWKYNHSSIRKILCVSEQIVESLKKDIRHPEKLSVVYSGVDPDRFTKRRL